MLNPNEDKQISTEAYDQRLMGNVVRLPLTITEAKGSHVKDAETGNWLLDFWGDEGVCSLGYNTPEFNQAMYSFKETGEPHQLPDVYPNRTRWDAAEVICDAAGMDRIFFANSGTEANEAAIKLARKYWWDKEGRPMFDDTHAKAAYRHQIYTIQGNFHGRTGLASAASDPRVSPYHRWGFLPSAPGFGVLDYDGENFNLAVEDGAETNADPYWPEVAAIILAPILGNNVVQTYPPAFWQALARLREEHGVLLIHDDVQAGSGRSGHYATWQHPDIQVKPDILCLGKGMALGFPMSAMLARGGVAKSFTPGVHFNTFAGSPFVCHMAIMYFDWLKHNLGAVRETGEYIRAQLRARDWIAEVDGSGMMNGFKPAFERFAYTGYQFCHAARFNGLLLVSHREKGTIRFTPPMNVKRDDLDEAFDALDKTHAQLAT